MNEDKLFALLWQWSEEAEEARLKHSAAVLALFLALCFALLLKG